MAYPAIIKFSYISLSLSLNTLKTTLSKELLYISRKLNTVSNAISAALSFGKWNSPVDMQQNATDLILFVTQHSKTLL